MAAKMCEDSTKQDVDGINKSLNDIQKHLECSICLEMLSNPYSTKCNHQFCWECINNFIQRCGKKSSNKWFCPLCKASVSCRSLTANPKLAEIIDAVHKLKNAVTEDIEAVLLSCMMLIESSISSVNQGNSQQNDNNDLIDKT